MNPTLMILTGDKENSNCYYAISSEDYQNGMYMGTIFGNLWDDINNGLADFDKSVLQPIYKDPTINAITQGVIGTAGALLSPFTGGASIAVAAAADTALTAAGSHSASVQKANVLQTQATQTQQITQATNQNTAAIQAKTQTEQSYLPIIIAIGLGVLILK